MQHSLRLASAVAATLVAVGSASADFVVNTNLGTITAAGTRTLTGTTVGGPNNASYYTNSNTAATWAEEYVYQFTTTAPFTFNLTTNDPNSGPTGPDNDFFLTNTLATPGGVGQAIDAVGGAAAGFSGIEVSGSYGLQPAGTYYLIADAFRGAATNPSTATAISGTLAFVGTGPATPPPSTATTYGGSINGTLATGAVQFFSFSLTTPTAVTFDTLGSNLGPTNDTELFLFDSTGALLGTDDDDATAAQGGELLSILNSGDELPALLPVGTYYLAIGGYNTTSTGTGFNAVSTSTYSGAFHINGVSVVPEPTTLAALGMGGLLLRRRRQA